MTYEPNRLEDVAQMFLTQNQPKQQEQSPFIMAGGKPMGMADQSVQWQDRLQGGLSQLATNYLMQQKIQKRNQFFKSVNDVMGTGNTEEKKNALRQLITQHGGEDYGLEIKEALFKDKNVDKNTEWKPTTQKEAIEFEQAKVSAKRLGGKVLVSPMVDKISKNEDAYTTLESSFQTLEANKDKFSQFMGPGKGILRNPVRSYVNKDLQDFLAWKANVQDAFQQYRVAVTGAQASDKEIALLAKNRPNENDTYDVFAKKTKAVRKVGNQVLSRYIKNLGKAGYDVSGYQETLDGLNADLDSFNAQPQTADIKEQYNALREQGISAREAKKRLEI